MGQKTNQKWNWKTSWNKWKWKYNIPKLIGYSKNSSEREFIARNAYIKKKKESSQINLTLPQKGQKKPKVRKKKKLTNIK